MQDEYEPYGDDWVKEMMKFDKIALISMLREELQHTESLEVVPTLDADQIYSSLLDKLRRGDGNP